MTSRPAGVVVGVDGGGTATEVIVADLAGEVLASAATSGSNHEMIGLDAMADVLADAVDEALSAAGASRADVVASVFGLAGVDWPSDVDRVGDAVGRLGLGGTRLVVNDSQVALRAGCRQPWGIVSCVGTGSVTAGRGRRGDWFRTMGVGFGEPSGAGTIVRGALDAVAATHHGAAEPTALTERFLSALGHPDVLAMFEALTRRPAAGLRWLAPVVTELADGDDPAARRIVTEVATRHSELVVGVARRLELVDDSFDVVTAGAVHRAGGVFSETFAVGVERALPGATIVALTTSSAVGAVRLALDTLER
jgi:N-acetylglucosamine kinase-like BadF-type ATPase